MSFDNNHKKFTAADIEKYHNGLLSPSQRHAMEKAALDDPFLADALEGYAVTDDVSADMLDLDNRLQKRLGNAKLIPIGSGSRKIPWLRIAVMLVLLAGGAIIASQLLFNKKEPAVAVVDKKVSVNPTVADSQQAAPVTTIESGNSDSSTAEVIQPGADKTVSRPGSVNDISKEDIITSKTENSVPAISTDPAAEKNREEDNKETATVSKASEKGLVTGSGKDGVAQEKKNQSDYAKQRSAVAKQSPAEKNDLSSGYFQLNTFRGRVIDNNNRGLPFANVTNTRDNIGTYTDATGNFVLTSPDTILEVQVRSLGYDNNLQQLRNTVANNTVVMEGDRDVVAETIISRSNSNAMRRQTDNMKIEEPEPADGWENYDVYLANNLNIPVDYTPKPSTQHEVELSFEVNKEGEPVNIRVERSLCKSCDDEAIRLVKDGPKWKRKAKKRTRVTVAF